MSTFTFNTLTLEGFATPNFTFNGFNEPGTFTYKLKNGFTASVAVHGDNEATVAVLENGRVTEATKYGEVREATTLEQVVNFLNEIRSL